MGTRSGGYTSKLLLYWLLDVTVSTCDILFWLPFRFYSEFSFSFFFVHPQNLVFVSAERHFFFLATLRAKGLVAARPPLQGCTAAGELGGGDAARRGGVGEVWALRRRRMMRA